MLRGLVLLLLFGFSSTLQQISLPIGSSFTVTCIQEPDVDFLFPTYTWTFSPKDKQNDLKQAIQLNWTESELSFTPVEPQHAGIYTCVAKGHSNMGLMKRKRKFNIIVEDIPVLFWFVVIVKEGSKVSLPCRPDLTTQANTSYANGRWSRGSTTRYTSLTPLKDSSRISWEAGPNDSDWSIEINDVKPEDSDLYLCGVTVGSEQHTVKVELIVEPAPPPRCLNQTHPWEECPDPDNRSWRKVLSESMTAFSAHLYSKLRSDQRSQNLLISPISIAGLLSHLLLGARGETRAELESALFLPTESSCLHSEMKKLRERTVGSLQMASQMFYNPKHELGEAFVNQSLEFYSLVPEKLTQSNEENVKMINDWVKKNTQEKITELVDSVEPSTEFILVNAVYFIGEWTSSFEEIEASEFITLSGEEISVPALYSSKFSLTTSYMTKLKAQVAKFPLTGESSLYVLVPNTVTEKALKHLEGNLNENNLREMVEQLGRVTPVSAEVTLPKTTLAISTDLSSLLKKIGLSGLFNSPNLCGVFSEEKTVELTDGRHQAFLSLTEKGVEAAAASSLSFSRSYNTFSAMQPFVLIVWSEQTDCPLFMGRVTDPTNGERTGGERERDRAK